MQTIKNIRSTLGITQVELAAAIGASVRTVRGWEQGRGNPSAENNRRLRLLQTDEAQRQRTFYGSVHALLNEALTHQQMNPHPSQFWDQAARALLTISPPHSLVTDGPGQL